jgi:hypothetical protein
MDRAVKCGVGILRGRTRRWVDTRTVRQVSN